MMQFHEPNAPEGPKHDQSQCANAEVLNDLDLPNGPQTQPIDWEWEVMILLMCIVNTLLWQATAALAALHLAFVTAGGGR